MLESQLTIPTERAWIRTCIDLGFQPKDIKGLRQIYRNTHPTQTSDLGAGPPYAVRYRGLIIRGRGLKFNTPQDAEDWAIENYKGSFDGWEVVSLSAQNGQTHPNGMRSDG
jgi:hypothetical protein